jgi:predicted TIM-barrel fold metal-dependent hydrolase
MNLKVKYLVALVGTLIALLAIVSACGDEEAKPFEEQVWDQRIDAAMAPSECPDEYSADLPIGSYTGPLTDAHFHIPHLPDSRPNQREFERGFLTLEDLDQELGQRTLLGLNITIRDVTCTLEREGTEKAWAFFPVFQNIPEQSIEVAARTMDAYPDQFVPFIMSPGPHDVPPSVEADVLREMLEAAPPNFFRGYGEIGLYAIQGVRPDYPPDHKMFDEIYDIVEEYGLAVYLHPGNGHEGGLARVLEAHPDTTFIVHGDGIQPAIDDLMSRFPNVYYGIDGIYGDQYLLKSGETTETFIEAISDRERILQIDVDEWGEMIEKYPTRFVWGVDREPRAHWTYTLEASEAIISYMREFIGRLDPAVQENFAYKNAARLFPPR